MLHHISHYINSFKHDKMEGDPYNYWENHSLYTIDGLSYLIGSIKKQGPLFLLYWEVQDSLFNEQYANGNFDTIPAAAKNLLAPFITKSGADPVSLLPLQVYEWKVENIPPGEKEAVYRLPTMIYLKGRYDAPAAFPKDSILLPHGPTDTVVFHVEKILSKEEYTALHKIQAGIV